MEWLIDLFLDRHSSGLFILLGTLPFPDLAELDEMIRYTVAYDLGVRVQGGVKTPEAQRVVETTERVVRTLDMVGGIERINAEFRKFKAERGGEWRLLRDYTQNVKPGRSFSSETATAQSIARRYHMHEDTLRRQRNKIVRTLAREIWNPSDSDDFKLCGGSA